LTWKGFHSEENATPRTIILTKDKILLCEEDYSKWHSQQTGEEGFSLANMQGRPAFQVIKYHNISDLTEIVSLQIENP
jgi:hypothetical protein